MTNGICKEVDEEDIGQAANCLIQRIPYAGVGVEM